MRQHVRIVRSVFLASLPILAAIVAACGNGSGGSTY